LPTRRSSGFLFILFGFGSMYIRFLKFVEK
jgi:hypothetical protein